MSFTRLTLLGVTASFVIACGADDSPPSGVAGSASGGSSASGASSVSGSAGASGSASGHGGQGGLSSVGGSSSTAGTGLGGFGMVTAGTAGTNAGQGGGGADAGGTGGTGGATSGGSAGSGGAGGGGSTLPPTDDYSKSGPFATTVNMNVGPGNGYTVYRPSTLGQDGFKHAPIVFGPGIGQSVTVHATMLTNFASHGFVVVGTPVLNGGPGNASNLKSMEDGLEWILAQNEAMGSVYQGKLDVSRAVSMGYSVGGTAAVQLGGHAAIATTVSIHGHTAMSAMHGPLLQTTGTKDTVGLPLQQQTYMSSQVPTFLATLTNADHGYIQNAGGGEQRPAIVAWMRYWINGDEGAKRYFFGADCVLCKAPWENPQRKNWQ